MCSLTGKLFLTLGLSGIICGYLSAQASGTG